MAQGPRVLVVDDEERFRVTLARLLVLRGVNATAVGSAREALEELGSESYDVIVLDVKMPDMNGVEALAEIKRTHKDIEVIMLTGHASVDVAVDIMRLGGYEYLLKPCAVEDLMEKVESAFERKVAREQRSKRLQSTQGDPTS